MSESLSIEAAPPGPEPRMWLLASVDGKAPDWRDIGAASLSKWDVPWACVVYGVRESVERPT